jgi:3-oxoacyl-[acyl-carrier protein] reductase
MMERVAVVTGAGRGIGRAIASRLARDGAAVVVGYRSNAAAAEATVNEIRASGQDALAVRADATDAIQLAGLLDQAQETFGGLDIVVHTAYGFTFGPLATNTDEDYATTFAANSRATFELLRAAGRRLRHGGRFILVSTGATRVAAPGTALYAASKAAGEHLVRVAARELASRQITVNSVLPGHTETDGFTSAPVPVEEFRRQIPMGRLGQPSDIADAVGLLVSSDARWITGQSIAVDGGLTA